MDVGTRISCLLALAALDPPLYGDQCFRSWCTESALCLSKRGEEAKSSTMITTPRRLRGFSSFSAALVGLPRLGPLDIPRSIYPTAHRHAENTPHTVVEVRVLLYHAVSIYTSPPPLVILTCIRELKILMKYSSLVKKVMIQSSSNSTTPGCNKRYHSSM